MFVSVLGWCPASEPSEDFGEIARSGKTAVSGYPGDVQAGVPKHFYGPVHSPCIEVVEKVDAGDFLEQAAQVAFRDM